MCIRDRYLTDCYNELPKVSPLGSFDFEKDVTKARFNVEKTGYRFPTEGECTFACKAGTSTSRSIGSDTARLKHYAWYVVNSEKLIHEVAQKKPGVSGLFDMLGNVAEICLNEYRGVDGDEKRTFKRRLFGGHYNSRPEYLAIDPEESHRLTVPFPNAGTFGFRLARTYPADD